MEEDLSEDELLGWEIHDGDLTSIPTQLSSQNHENSGFGDDDPDTPIERWYSFNHHTLNSSQIRGDFGKITSMVDTEWVDPCLESCLRERVIHGPDSEDETSEKSLESVDSSAGIPEKMGGEADDVRKGQIRGDLGVDGRDVSIAELGAKTKERAWWWMFRLELLKASISRSKPLWFLSLGVVAMALILLVRKWNNMKRKARSSPLIKVSLEDKQKVSHFTIKTARLSEAFSAVQRLPAIRASWLPAGASPWPLIGLR